MTTLTTRINGYKAIVRPATAEEKQEFHESTFRNFGIEPNVSQAHVGAFVDEDGVEMSYAVPYMLRGFVLNVDANVILPVLVEKAKHHVSELTWHAERCDNETGDCKNHNARIAEWEAYVDRTFVINRGQGWRVAKRVAAAKARVERVRIQRELQSCDYIDFPGN